MRNDFCSNFLEHSAKGTTWKNTKYVGKVRLSSGKYLYFYDQAKYQRYLKSRSGSTSTEPTNTGKTVSSETMKKNSLKSYASKTTAEKKAATQNYINAGKAAAASLTSKASSSTVESGKTKMQELLEKARAKADSSSSKKKSGSSSSSSSKKSSGSSSKSKGSSSKSSGTKSTKEATAKTKTASTKTAKETTEKTTKTKQKNYLPSNEPISMDTLKKTHNIDDKDVNTHASTSDMMSKLKSYSNGAFGYISAGDKVYKWSKQGGTIVFKDFDSEKEVTLSEALTDIKEFRTDKGKKNKK